MPPARLTASDALSRPASRPPSPLREPLRQTIASGPCRQLRDAVGELAHAGSRPRRRCGRRPTRPARARRRPTARRAASAAATSAGRQLGRRSYRGRLRAARSDGPARPRSPTPPGVTWITSANAGAAHQPHRHRAAAAGRADHRHRPVAIERRCHPRRGRGRRTCSEPGMRCSSHSWSSRTSRICRSPGRRQLRQPGHVDHLEPLDAEAGRAPGRRSRRPACRSRGQADRLQQP